VSVRRVELLTALTFPAESTDHHNVVARINGLLYVSPKLIEVLRNGREDLVCHALSTVKDAPRSTPPAWLVPLNAMTSNLATTLGLSLTFDTAGKFG
jgi:hypothetical protein